MEWDFTQVDFVNPSASDITIDIFNSITLSNFAVAPNNTSSFPNQIVYELTTKGSSSRFSAFSTVNQFIYISIATGTNYYISVFNSVTNTFVTDISIPTEAIGELEYCSVLDRIYACGVGKVFVIDCATNTLFTTIVLPSVVNYSYSLSYDSSSNHIFCTQPDFDSTYRINCSTNLIVDTLTIAGSKPISVRYNPNNGFVYVLNTVLSKIIEVIPVGMVVNNSIPIPNPCQFSSALSLSNNSLYYQEKVTNDIRQFSCSTLTVNPTPISFSTLTLSIIYNPTSDLIYVCNSAGSTDSIDVYNPSTNLLVESILTPTTNYGTFGTLVFQSTKNSVYETSTTISPVAFGIFELAKSSGFYIVSPYNYNALLQDIQANPMLIRRIELIVKDQSQLSQPISILKRDANGKQAIYPRLPNIDVSVNQFQANMSYIDFNKNELILDDNSMFSQYTFPANSLTRMLIFYKQIKRIEMLTGAVIFKELESTLGLKDTKFSESDLRFMSNEPLIIKEADELMIQSNRIALKEKYFRK